jgi:hypothetical protein
LCPWRAHRNYDQFIDNVYNMDNTCDLDAWILDTLKQIVKKTGIDKDDDDSEQEPSSSDVPSESDEDTPPAESSDDLSTGSD